MMVTPHHGESLRPALLDRCAPRARLLAAAAFALAVIALSGWAALATAVLAGLAMVATAGLSARAVGHRLGHLDGFVMMAVASLPLVIPGEPVLDLGPVVVSREGLVAAAVIALKANAIALALFALVGTLAPAVLGRALTGLGVPEKLVHLLLLTVRYLSVLERDYQTLRRAMRARAFQPRSDRHTWETYGYLFGMLLVRGFERGDRVVAAMKCRGFTGRFPLDDAPPPAAADLALAMAILLLVGGLAGLDHPGAGW